MAVIREKTLKFPGLDNVYTFADEADLFDANVPCSAGEYRIYEGELYRCDADHTGAWNYAHFTPVKLGNEVSTALAASVGNFAQKTIENAAIATFDDGAENVPVKSLIVGIEPVQSGSGDPSPDNVRPITGHTGANVAVTGVNIWDEQWEAGYLDGSGGWHPNASGTQIGSKNFIPIKGNEEYCFQNTDIYRVCWYDNNKEFISTTTISLNSRQKTAPANAKYLKFSTSSVYGNVYLNNISINYPSNDTSYHPYTGTTIPIKFPAEAGTVYGVTLTNEDGVWKLKVDTATAEFDGSNDENWSLQGINTYNIANFSFDPKLPNYKVGSASAGISDTFKKQTTTAANTTESGFYITSQGYLFFRVDGSAISTVAEFTTWLASNNVQLVYELANPVEYTITAEAAKTLLGLNNIWVDTGDIVELTYRTMNNTDAKIRLTKALIAPVLDDMVAEEALSVNDFVIVGDTLYIITADVAADGTLTPGTNCTATTIGEQITALLNA